MSAFLENESVRSDLGLAQAPRFTVSFAQDAREVLESQQLRFRIFAGELGAQIDGGEQGVDRDQYDPWCRHLLVRETETGRLVACTRILTEAQAPDAGGFYSSGEFDLAMIDTLPGRFTVPEWSEVGAEAAGLPTSRTHSRSARNTVSVGCRVMEVGRTCVDREYRSGAAIATLWQGIAGYASAHGFDYCFGCASIGLEDGGAKACGEAYWDRAFNCADVFMLLNVSDLHPRYARHFLDRATAVPLDAGHA